MQKLALVTGGTKGIGAAIALDLKKNGYKVCVSYKNNQETAKNFSDEHQIKNFCFDVANLEDCKQSIEKIKNEFNQPIDILINNAGITCDTMFHKMTVEQWNNVINTNLNSIYNTCSCVINDMRKQKFGRIINISSINGFKGQLGQTNYSASKAALVGFSKSLALESAICGITVNIVAPGYIDTDITKKMPHEAIEKIQNEIPMKKFGTVEDISSAVLFLLTQNYITGNTIHINGGMYM